MLTRSCLFAAPVAAALLSPSFAMAQESVKIGALRCDVAPGIGVIIASQKEMHCIFTSASGYHESYAGSIDKVGVDVGGTGHGLLTWDVYQQFNGKRKGALAGNYGGVGASLTVGAGAGANAMVGGNEGGVTLQPVSVQTQTGLNVAGGFSGMTLRSIR